MNQFGKATDKVLHLLSRKIGKAEADIAAATKEKDEAWEQVSSSFSEFYREGRDARFIANDGYTLTLQKRQGGPKLDEAKLESLIRTKWAGDKGTRLWNSITKRCVDSDLLEFAIQQGKITADIVDQCLTVPEPTYARVRRVWTKDDVEKASLYGLQIRVEEGVN